MKLRVTQESGPITLSCGGGHLEFLIKMLLFHGRRGEKATFSLQKGVGWPYYRGTTVLLTMKKRDIKIMVSNLLKVVNI